MSTAVTLAPVSMSAEPAWGAGSGIDLAVKAAAKLAGAATSTARAGPRRTRSDGFWAPVAGSIQVLLKTGMEEVETENRDGVFGLLGQDELHKERLRPKYLAERSGVG